MRIATTLAQFPPAIAFPDYFSDKLALSLRVLRGVGRLPDDIAVPTPFGTTSRSSDARALLENLTRSAANASTRRTWGAKGTEQWLERLLAREGEERLNALRDHAKRIAPALSLERELVRLDSTIGALLGTRSAALSAPAAIARARGRPYDDARLIPFDRLLGDLAREAPTVPAADPAADPSLQAFVESYFSNYIEGRSSSSRRRTTSS